MSAVVVLPSWACPDGQAQEGKRQQREEGASRAGKRVSAVVVLPLLGCPDGQPSKGKRQQREEGASRVREASFCPLCRAAYRHARQRGQKKPTAYQESLSAFLEMPIKRFAIVAIVVQPYSGCPPSAPMSQRLMFPPTPSTHPPAGVGVNEYTQGVARFARHTEMWLASLATHADYHHFRNYSAEKRNYSAEMNDSHTGHLWLASLATRECGSLRSPHIELLTLHHENPLRYV